MTYNPVTNSYIPSLETGFLDNPLFSQSGGSLESAYQNIWNEQKALLQLQMQREDTAHQREVADLKAAGLNPWLSVQGSGASTSQYASPSKSALDSLISMLDLNVKSKSMEAGQTLGAIKTGLGIVGTILRAIF